MTAGLEIWQQELQQLRMAAREVSDAMTRAAVELRDDGAEPTEGLLQQMQQFRADFRRLRECVLEDGNGLTRAVSLQDLGAELQQRARVSAALKLVERAAELRTRTGETTGPMFERLQGEIAHARQALAAATPSLDTIQALDSGRHPLVVAVKLAEGADDLTDDDWSQAMESVTASLGRELATALARGRLMIGKL